MPRLLEERTENYTGPGLTQSQIVRVRAMQIADGHVPCFRTEARFACREIDCEWRDSCTRLVAEWKSGTGY